MGKIRTAVGGEREQTQPTAAQPNLIAQQIGSAIVYFRVSGQALPVTNESHIRAVTATNVFDEAARVVNEGVRVIGLKVHDAAKTLRPCELELEISFGFELKGRATIVPVLLTGESTSTAGLKITATWKFAEKA
ncbi:MAG TPA: CU044_2847 family protein [Candidatus Binatia bacterium]|nr:CU044_2847 family protein [Candidatus Binatia bacterium]